jgi:hypothetical protein
MSMIGTLVPSRLAGFGSEVWRHVRRFARQMGGFITLIVALLAAAAAGLGSAWYMIDRGTFLTVDNVGPWRSWSSEGNPEADPYTQAHLAREGRLSVTSTAARYFLARTDSTGRVLTSNCEYLLEGPPIDAKWWSITLFDARGRLVPNAARRFGFNSAEIVRLTDGSHQVAIARQARTGNWLPSGSVGGRELNLWLSIFMPSNVVGGGFSPEKQLPRIRRVGCG